MTAKQILVSASLVIGMASAGSAAADPDPAEGRSTGEVSEDSSDERPPGGRFEIGAGYQPDDQFLAAARVASDDLFGSGDQLSIQAMMSARRQLFLVHFADPSLVGSQVGLSADLFSNQTEWPGFTRTGGGGALTLSRPIGRGVRAFVSYRIENVEVDAVNRDASAPDDPEWGTGWLRPSDLLLSSVRAGVELGSESGFLPRRGSSAGAWIEAADRRIGSDANLVRGRIWASHHQPIGPLTLHLGGRAEAIGSSDPRGVPLSERLQLDGSSDVRGLAPGALGRIDEMTGAALGGDVLMTGRAELELPVLDRLGLSVIGFVDGGAVMDARAETADLGASAGLGLLWRSPIGPLRVDWAFSLDGDRSAPQVLFSLGGSF